MKKQTTWITIDEIVINNHRYAVDVQIPVTLTMDEQHDDNTCVVPNDYAGMAAWIEVEKEHGKDWYAQCNYNRSEMARRLGDMHGWAIDVNSLRKAMVRYDKIRSSDRIN